MSFPAVHLSPRVPSGPVGPAFSRTVLRPIPDFMATVAPALNITGVGKGLLVVRKVERVGFSFSYSKSRGKSPEIAFFRTDCASSVTVVYNLLQSLTALLYHWNCDKCDKTITKRACCSGYPSPSPSSFPGSKFATACASSPGSYSECW